VVGASICVRYDGRVAITYELLRAAQDIIDRPLVMLAANLALPNASPDWHDEVVITSACDSAVGREPVLAPIHSAHQPLVFDGFWLVWDNAVAMTQTGRTPNPAPPGIWVAIVGDVSAGWSGGESLAAMDDEYVPGSNGVLGNVDMAPSVAASAGPNGESDLDGTSLYFGWSHAVSIWGARWPMWTMRVEHYQIDLIPQTPGRASLPDLANVRREEVSAINGAGAGIWQNGTMANVVGTPVRGGSSPSVAADRFSVQNVSGHPVREEPIAGFESNIMLRQGSTSINASAVILNRRGSAWSRMDYWNRVQEQAFISLPGQPPQAHPSVAGFPNETMKTDAVAAMTWSCGTDIFLAKAWATAYCPFTIQGQNNIPPFAPVDLSLPGRCYPIGGVEPGLGHSRWQERAMFNPPLVPALIWRDALPPNSSVPLVRILSSPSNLMSKTSILDNDSTATYVGAAVGLDSIAMGVFFGDVQIENGPDTSLVAMHVSWSDTIAGSGLQGISELQRLARSETFSLTSGSYVQAGTYAIGDSFDIASFGNIDATATFRVEIVDSASGQIVLPLYTIIAGGHHPLLGLPQIFPTFYYSGASIEHAMIRVRVTVTGAPDSSCGGQAFALHTLGPVGNAFGKLVPRQAGALPVVDEVVAFPTPTNSAVTVEYKITRGGRVSVVVTDVTGRQVYSLIDRDQRAGYYAVGFTTSTLFSGEYAVEVRVDGLPTVRSKVIVAH
jgi:hypothetical protein